MASVVRLRARRVQLHGLVRPRKRERSSAANRAHYRLKTSLDRALAALLLIVALPVLLLLMAIVKLTSRGPAIYCQPRIGKDGRVFVLYKVRTMRVDAEAGTGAVWARQQDPRVTPVGRVMRAMHLDELPQLFNVLRGEMSLIGPRPERPEFVQQLFRQVPGYLERLHVPPGITGLAQVNLPPDATLEDVERKLVLDREYVRKANLLLDARILFCTALQTTGLPKPWCARALGIQRRVMLEKRRRPRRQDATPDKLLTA